MSSKFVGNLPIDLESVVGSEPSTLFTDVAFVLSGNVDSRIPSLLENAGAKQKTYVGVNTTHFITGPGADDMKSDEAKDIFELPVVVQEWAALSLKLGKLLSIDGFERCQKQLFSSVVMTASGIRGKDLVALSGMVTYYGGVFLKNLTSSCTHLISNRCSGNKYKVARDKGLKVVSCDWVIECIKNDGLVDESGYDPTLLVTNQPPAPPPAQARVPVPNAVISRGQTNNNNNNVVVSEAKQNCVLPPPSPSIVGFNNPNQFSTQQYSMPRQGVPQQPNLLQNQLMTTPAPTAIRQSVPGGSNNVPGSPGPNRLRYPSPQPHNQLGGDSSPHLQQNQGQTNMGFNQPQTPSPVGQIHPSPPHGGMGSPMVHHSPQMQGNKPQFPISQMGPPQSPQMCGPPTPGAPQTNIQKSTPPMLGSPGAVPNQMVHQMQKPPNQFSQPHPLSNIQQQRTTPPVQSPQGNMTGQMTPQHVQMAPSPTTSQPSQSPVPMHQMLPGQPGVVQNQMVQQQQQMVPNQIMQCPPQQMIHQNDGQQILQPQSQQMMQTPPGQQMVQVQQGQHMMTSQQQAMQVQNSQQMIQMSGTGGQQIIHAQGAQFPGQATPASQMMQGPGQQMIQQPGQQMIQGQPQQPMMQNQGQQMMQGQGTQQMILQRPMVGNQQQMMMGQGGQQMMGGSHVQQGQHQFHQQAQYQPQGMQRPQFQVQAGMKSPIQQQQFNQMQQPHQMPNHQVRFSMGSPQSQHSPGQPPAGHFQNMQSQQGPRPQQMMAPMQPRGQFQSMQPQSPQTSVPMTQQHMYRQGQPQQGHMQMFHSLQQQRLQSPPLPGQTQQQSSPGIQQMPPQQQQQSHVSPQGQMMSPQMQQQGQQQPYNVVIPHQQFPQNQNVPHNQQMQPGLPQGMQQQQRMQFQPPGSPSPQWTQQQQIEIIQQIQKDPQIRAQWARMDNTQRQLLMQKLAQKRREEQVREMLLRQQHMTQQNLGSQNVGQQIPNQSQIPISSQQPVASPQSQMMQGPQTPTGQVMEQKGMGHQQMHLTSIQGDMLSPTGSASGQPQQHSPQVPPQQQVLLHQDMNKAPQSPMLHPNQVMIPGHPQQQRVTVPNSQMSPSNHQQQKFLAPAPVHSRPPGQPQTVRTQQIFTPQVAQQSNQSSVQIQQIVVQQGQVRRPGPMQQIPNQRMPIMQQQQPNQWHSSQQRVITPGPQSPFPRTPGTPTEAGPGSSSQWSARPQTPSPQSPGGQPNVSYVQVVNSKTKTALANLLSNRLQGNSESASSTSISTTSAPSTTSTSTTTVPISSSLSTATTSTTQAMFPPLPSPQVTSQNPFPHSAPAATTTTQSSVLSQRKTLANITNGCKTIQVNSFGGARVASSQASPTISALPARPQYFGHDPQLKFPPGCFFIGCTFWGIQSEDSRIWKHAVERYGGTVVAEYGPMVTHVVADHCRSPQFHQALREGKRIVTMFWINDCIERSMMIPPFQPFHLPPVYPKGQPPFANEVFSTTNFPQKEKGRLIAILKQMGAKYTSYFTQLNTILVCNKPEGSKYQKAREWKKPVVNTQFIAEVYLGHNSLSLIHSPKYQCFNPDQPFRFDYSLAQHLMAPWKVPLRVTPDALENFRTKRNATDSPDGEPGNKRLRLEDGSSSTFSPLDIDTEPLSPPPQPLPVQSFENHVDEDKNNGHKPKEVLETILVPDDPQDVVANTSNDAGESANCNSSEQKDSEVMQANGPLNDLENSNTSDSIASEGVKPLTEIKSEVHDDSQNEIKKLATEGANGEEEGQKVVKIEPPDEQPMATDTNHVDEAGKILTNGDFTPTKKEEPDLLNSASNVAEDSQPSLPKNPEIRRRPPIVIVSGFTREYKQKMKAKIEMLGGVFTTDWKNATHLVLKDHYLTTKLFLALVKFEYITTSDWIYKSVVAGRFLDEKPFIPRHEFLENKYNTTIAELLTKPDRHVLFRGVTFFLAPGDWFLKDDVANIVEAAGGIVDRTQHSLRHIRDYTSRYPKRTVIITHLDDFQLMMDFYMKARRPHLMNIYTPDFIWTCIATRTIKLKNSQLQNQTSTSTPS